MGKMQKRVKQLSLLLAMMFVFVVSFAVQSFAQELDDSQTPGEIVSEETSSEETSSEETASEETSSEETSSEETSSEETSSEAPTEPTYVLVAMGDLDNSGTVDSGDARKILRMSVGLESINSAVWAYADLDNDGEITAGDARLTLRTSVGLESIVKHAFQNRKVFEVTCVTIGSLEYSCQHCDLTGSITVAKLAHTYASVDIDPATCLTDGLDKQACSSCGETREVVLKAKGHNFKESGRTEPTCIKTGAIHYTCTNCNGTHTESLNVVDHNYKLTKNQAATCTAAGVKEYTCSGCNATKQETIKIIDHNYKLTKDQAATCTVAGVKEYTCSGCNATKQETIKANGHAYKLTKDQAATCTAAGAKEYTCSVCSDVFSQSIAATGHKMVRCTATTPQYCSNCNEKYTGVQQAATGLYYYFEKSGNTYAPAKNKIVGSAYYGPDGARVDDDAINAAVNFVNTYVGSNGTQKERLQRAYNIFYQYYKYFTINTDVTDKPDGRYLPGYCTYFFNNGGGNCYRFASALAYVARVLGYDTGFISGQITAAAGGTTEHGLTEIYVNGQTIWCDAMMQTSYPSVNTFWVTESSYYYGYTREYRIKMYVENGKVTWK